MTGDPEKIVQACALDPLTAAALTLKEIREMATEMLEREARVAAAVRGQATAADADDRYTPRARAHAKVPVDPALAINARFGELASSSQNRFRRDRCLARSKPRKG